MQLRSNTIHHKGSISRLNISRFGIHCHNIRLLQWCRSDRLCLECILFASVLVEFVPRHRSGRNRARCRWRNTWICHRMAKSRCDTCESRQDLNQCLPSRRHVFRLFYRLFQRPSESPCYGVYEKKERKVILLPTFWWLGVRRLNSDQKNM